METGQTQQAVYLPALAPLVAPSEKTGPLFPRISPLSHCTTHAQPIRSCVHKAAKQKKETAAQEEEQFEAVPESQAFGEGVEASPGALCSVVQQQLHSATETFDSRPEKKMPEPEEMESAAEPPLDVDQ